MRQYSKAGDFGKAGSHVYLGHSCVTLQHGNVTELWEKSVIFHRARACQEVQAVDTFFPLQFLDAVCTDWYLILLLFSEIIVLCYITPLSTELYLKEL